MKLLPLARNENIVVQELGREVLVYDLQTHKAFNLNETSAIVYKACDGFTTFVELKSKHKFTDEIIYLALDELKKQKLIEADYNSPFAGMNRREVIRKVGLASLVALPIISSLVAPRAADAQSAAACMALGESCTPPATPPGSNNCCSGLYCENGTSTCTTCLGSNSRSANCGGTQASCNTTCNSAAGFNFRCCSGQATARPTVFPGFFDCVCT